MNILICNVGSTSLKYQLFNMDAGEKVLASGGAERVGAAKSIFYHKDSASGSTIRREDVFPTHKEAISAMLEQLLGENQKKGPGRKPVYIIKDVRLFLNSVSRGMDTMRRAGVDAKYDKQESEEQITITIQIPKRKSAG